MTRKKSNRRTVQSGESVNPKNIQYAAQYLRTFMVPDEKHRPSRRSGEDEMKKRYVSLRFETGNPLTSVELAALEGMTLNERRELMKRETARLEPMTLGGKIKSIGAPYEGYCIILDTETTPSDGQKLRIGYYQVRGIHSDQRKHLARQNRLTREALDGLVEHGLFYDETMSTDEIDVLKRSIPHLEGYMRARGAPEPFEWMPVLQDAPALKLLTREEFARQIIARYAKMQDALFIGHNLAFDLGALARKFGPAKGDYYGGQWLKYCICDHEGDCGFHPPILIKKIGRQKHFIGWRRSVNPATKKKGVVPDVTIGKAHFLDTATFASALLKPKSNTLAYLCELLGTTTKKGPDQEHGAPLTVDYVSYNMRDVQSTWEVFCKLRAEYRKHNLSREVWWIYSSASLGAAYYEEMGVPKFLDQNSHFPPEYIGYSMSAYYGGRSEVRIRKKPREVMLLDFKSQYPTVNALMGLQDLLLAERIGIKQSPEHLAEICAFVDRIELEELQRSATWPKLRGYVRVVPDGDVLPFRAQYDEKGGTNIGLNSVSGSTPVWCALADVIGSKLLTGKMPKIIDAFELVPQGRVATKSIKFFGDDRFVVDLTRDFFVRIIEMRIEIEALAESSKDEVESERLYAMAQALKFIANSTSYGKLVELNIEEREERRGATVYDGDGNATRVWLNKIEKPGKYFAGPIGSLIPAAGRLLLAMAEKLGADRGLSYVFCDTDSMCFAKPETMPRGVFRSHVETIANWFTMLSPYRDSGGAPVPLLKIEDVNYREGKEAFGYEPLYCYAVSPKRYALYNRLQYHEAIQARYVQAQRVAVDNGEAFGDQRLIVIRKFSAHGTGEISQPDNYQPTLPVVINPKKLGKSPYAAHLLHDLWRAHLEAVEAGYDPEFDLSNLATPRFKQITVSSQHYIELYGDLPGIRPFSFFTQIPTLVDKIGAEVPGNLLGIANELKSTSFYAPLGKSFDEIKVEIRRADTHERLDLGLVQRCGLSFQTIADSLLGYFDRLNFKAFPPDEIGEHVRRNIVTTEFRHIGKETNAVKDAANLDTDYEVDKLVAKKRSKRARRRNGDTASPQAQFLTRSSFAVSVLADVNLVELSAMIGISVKTLQSYASGRRMPKEVNAAKITAALQQLARHGFDVQVASKACASENEATRKLAAKQEQAELRDRVRAVIHDFWHHTPSPETYGFQYIDDAPGYVRDVTTEVRKIEDYILPMKAQDRIARTHTSLEKKGSDPSTVVKTSTQLTKFRRGMKLDAQATRKLKKAIHRVELEDQTVFDGMAEAFSWQAIEYQTSEGEIVRVPHPGAEFWRQLRPPYICS